MILLTGSTGYVGGRLLHRLEAEGRAVRCLVVGLRGLAYWYGVFPLHALVFRGMLHGIARAAERGE